MKPIYLCALLITLSACTPARYNNNPKLSKSAGSVETKQKLENTAYLQEPYGKPCKWLRQMN